MLLANAQPSLSPDDRRQYYPLFCLAVVHTAKHFMDLCEESKDVDLADRHVAEGLFLSPYERPLRLITSRLS